MAPPTAGDDSVERDGRVERDGPSDRRIERDGPSDGDPSRVAAALDAADDGLAEAVESALAGRSAVVAVGVPLALLPPTLAARERTEDETPWRIACRPGVADALGRAFVLGTAVAEAVAEGAIELRTTRRDSDAERVLFASPERVDAVAGPEGDRTLVGEEASERVAPAGGAVRERFAAAASATVDMPARSRLLAAAREALDDRFAGDVEAALDALPYGAVGRSGELTDRTFLVALAARHDHLLWDLRRWIGGEARVDEGTDGDDESGVGVAAGQDLTGDRRALVRRGLIEAVRVPAGDGRPRLRLRAADDALLAATPTEVLSLLRARFALPVDVGEPPEAESGERRPVWERRGRAVRGPDRRDKN